MKKGDKASPSIILAGRALLVKMVITLGPHGIFYLYFVYLCILTLSSHWYEKGDEASLVLILAGRALLVKVLITLEMFKINVFFIDKIHVFIQNITYLFR